MFRVVSDNIMSNSGAFIRQSTERELSGGQPKIQLSCPQFGPSLSDYFLYPRFAALWPFRDDFTSAGNTSCENSSRGLTSLKGGLAGK